MSRLILFDEFHLELHIPRSLADADCRAIGRTLHSRGFQSQLREAVRQVLGRYTALNKVRIVLSR